MRFSKFRGLRDFFLIWSGQLISVSGSRLSSFALGIWILRTTGSTTDFAMTFVAMTGPGLIVATFAGALVDRWDRRATMIACDALAGLSMVFLAGVGLSGSGAVWGIYSVVAAASFFDAFRSPAFAASIPLLASTDQLPRVNGLAQTGGALAEIIGPLCAGALVSLLSLRGILLVDALTFAIGAGTLALSRIPRAHVNGHNNRVGMFESAMLGWKFLHKRDWLIGILALNILNGFLLSIACVVIAPMLLSFASPAQLGVQYAVGGFGLLLGSLTIAAWGGPKRRINGVLGSTAISGICLAAHGLRPSFALVTVAGFLLFLMIPVTTACSNSLLQAKIPGDLQGRIFAIQLMTGNVVTILGYCVAGPLSSRVFNPLLMGNWLLRTSVGRVIGFGPQRGLGLLFVVLGILMCVSSFVAYSVPAIRAVDDVGDSALSLESGCPDWVASKAEYR